MELIFAIQLLIIFASVNAGHQTHLLNYDLQAPVYHVRTHGSQHLIGSRNHILLLSEDLQPIQNLTCGPVHGVDNHVTLLTVIPDRNNDSDLLFWCGSIDNGVCHLHRLPEISRSPDIFDSFFAVDRLEAVFDRKGVPMQQREVLNYGVFGHFGSLMGNYPLVLEQRIGNETGLSLLITATSDGRADKHVPLIGFYSLKQTPTEKYFLVPSVFRPNSPLYSWLAMNEDLVDSHPIRFIKIFTFQNYVYAVSLQKSVISKSSPEYQTRISRFQKDDLVFNTYAEVKVVCGGINIAVDAALNIAVATEPEKQEALLYLLFGQAEIGPYPSTKRSSVCSVSMDTVNNHLEVAYRRCHRGKGKLVDWYYGYEKKCSIVVSGVYLFVFRLIYWIRLLLLCCWYHIFSLCVCHVDFMMVIPLIGIYYRFYLGEKSSSFFLRVHHR